MKSSKFLLASVLLLFVSALFGQNEKLAQPKIISGKMDAALQKQISLDSGMIKAMASMESDGEFITLSEGSVRRVENLKNAVEVVWNIKTRVKGRVPEYARLFYTNDGNGITDVYFEGKNKVPKINPTAPETPQVQGVICGSWSGWAYVGKACENNFWCNFGGKKACYYKYERRKQCPWGVQVDKKSVKQYCGCCN